MSDKREDYLTWDEYFMGVAMLSGMRSKDPNTQVGCCIVSQDNKILSMGYNGFPKGCSDDEFPWAREGENPLETKYVYSTHSELNAILNYSGGSLVGAKLYVSLFPCNECAKAIIQSGIKEVIYDCDKYAGVNWVSLNSETGIEVSNSNALEFGNAIEKLLSNDALRDQYGRNAKRRVEENFLMEIVGPQYNQLYKSLKS